MEGRIDWIMRKPERPGTVSQKAAVKNLRQRAYEKKRREATSESIRETVEEFEEQKKAKEAAQADDAASGTSSGGRQGFGLDM